jgi:hypothetical protein
MLDKRVRVGADGMLQSVVVGTCSGGGCAASGHAGTAVHPSIRPIQTSTNQFIHPFIHPSVHQFIHQSIN